LRRQPVGAASSKDSAAFFCLRTRPQLWRAGGQTPEDLMMRTVFLLFKATTGIAVFLLLLAFAVKNTDSVAVRYFLGAEWRAPLVVVLLVFFAAGIALGVMASLAFIVRQRRQILNLRRQLRGAAQAPVPPSMAESA
jgi:uncharacterized integral membrane protein